MKKHKCWTCAHAGYCHKPISGWDATFHHNSYDNHDTWTVHECPEYEYDGECMTCIRNIDKEKKCRYDSCPFFIKGRRGRCAEENWKRQWEKENGMPFVEVE